MNMPNENQDRTIKEVQRELGNVGQGTPRIVDVEWKLDMVTNSSGVKIDNLMYTVVLKTDRNEDIVFKCDVLHLQDLVTKLKDIVRHCDKVRTGAI